MASSDFGRVGVQCSGSAAAVLDLQRRVADAHRSGEASPVGARSAAARRAHQPSRRFGEGDDVMA